MTFHDLCKETLMLSWSNILFFGALGTTSQVVCVSVIFHGCLLWLRFLHRRFKAPATPASKLCRSNLRIELRKVHRTRWHVGRNLKTDVCRCRLPAAEGGGVGDCTAVIVPSGEWQQQQDDHLILLKLGSSVGPSLISGTRVFVLCHSYLMDVQQSEWEAKGFI